MNKSRLAVVFSLVAIVSLTLASCATPTPQVVVQTQAVMSTAAPVVQTQVVVQTAAPEVQTQIVQVTAVPAAQPKTIVTWTQFDQGNVDPKADERVGNDYMRKYIPIFNQAFAGKYVWDNQFSPWDRVTGKIVAAVQAKAEVPDIVQVGSTDLNTYVTNGTFQDLTAWAKAQSWYADMDPSALASCTAPDGKLYCIPLSGQPLLVYAWKDRFPNGFPKTPDDWLADGAALQKQGKYAMTYYGSTWGDGDAANRAIFGFFTSFGGGYDDGHGHLALNTPQNVAAVTWVRQMVQKQSNAPRSTSPANLRKSWRSRMAPRAPSPPASSDIAISTPSPRRTARSTPRATRTISSTPLPPAISRLCPSRRRPARRWLQ